MKDLNAPPYEQFAQRFMQACAKLQKDGKAPKHEILAKLFQVSRPMISNYTSGRKLPSMKTACLIAELTDVPMDWLMLGRGSPDQGSASLKSLWESTPESERVAFLADLAARKSE